MKWICFKISYWTRNHNLLEWWAGEGGGGRMDPFGCKMPPKVMLRIILHVLVWLVVAQGTVQGLN